MNTNHLISENEEIYKNFFNSYDIVISSPIIITLVWDLSYFALDKTSCLTQKISLRNYIGYNKWDFDNEEIEYIVRDSKKGFIKQNIETKYPINKKLLKKLWINWKIWFLSEYNSANPPSIISNILWLKLLIDGKIKISDFENLNIESKDFNKILGYFIDLDKFFLKKFNFFGLSRKNSLFLWDTLLSSDSHILSVKDWDKYIFRNMWENYDFSQLDLTLTLLNPNISFKNNYSFDFLYEKTNKVIRFLKKMDLNISLDNNVNLFNSINDIWNFYSLKTYKNLLRLYWTNFSWVNFYRDLKIYRETLKSLFNNNISEKYNFIKNDILDLVNDENFKIYLDFIGVFSFTKIAIYSSRIWYIDNDFIENLNKKTNLDLILDYSSFYDWYERKWIKLEQFRSLGQLSVLSSEYMKYTYLNNELFTVSWDYSFLLKNTNWLILDLISRKLYLDGEKLNSKQIHSQNTTIEILEILLKNIGEDIQNKNLPKSSYSSNKNEMLWKIILPLVKLIEEKKKIKLPLICKWSINDFYLKLNNFDLEINLIKKLS